MKDIDLPNGYYQCIVLKLADFTVSELSVLGTAISNSSDASEGAAEGGFTELHAKEQKFMVLTSRMWRIHGCLLGSGSVSTGKTVLIDDSSSLDNLHTTSLLSLPCLRSY